MCSSCPCQSVPIHGHISQSTVSWQGAGAGTRTSEGRHGVAAVPDLHHGCPAAVGQLLHDCASLQLLLCCGSPDGGPGLCKRSAPLLRQRHHVLRTSARLRQLRPAASAAARSAGLLQSGFRTNALSPHAMQTRLQLGRCQSQLPAMAALKWSC